MSNITLPMVVQQIRDKMLPDRGDGWINRFEIESGSSNRLYTISQNTKQGNRWECSCPAWRTRRTCKHLTALEPALATIGAPKPAQPAPWPVLVAPRTGGGT